MTPPMKIFGLGESKGFADQVCRELGQTRAKHQEEAFGDGEGYIRSEENVRGHDCFVIQSLYNSKNQCLADKFLNLLFFAGSLRDASAARITMVAPILSHSRQDRKTQSRAPVYTKYVPQMIESILRTAQDRVLTMDVHNLSAFQTGFRLTVDHLEAKNLIADWVIRNVGDLTDLVVGSPDEGGVKRAGFCRKRIEKIANVKIGTAQAQKTREGRKTETHEVVGNVKGKRVLLVDDMIGTGGTLLGAAEAIKTRGGKVWAVAATHGLFIGSASRNIAALQKMGVQVVVTDTAEPQCLGDEVKAKIIKISTASLFAEAIRCIHNEESLSRLFTDDLNS